MKFSIEKHKIMGLSYPRHFGFFANRVKKEMIRICRMLLEGTTELSAQVKKTLQELMPALTGTDITRCPVLPERPHAEGHENP